MRLSKSSKSALFNYSKLYDYCRKAGIDMDKLHRCEVFKMDDTYFITLDKENVTAKNGPFLEADRETQPDVMFELNFNGKDFDILDTEYTYRLLSDC